MKNKTLLFFPWYTFLAAWTIQLFTFFIPVSEIQKYTADSVAEILLLATVTILFFTAGFYSALYISTDRSLRIRFNTIIPHSTMRKHINIAKLYVVFAIITAITIANYIRYGYLPIMPILFKANESSNYITYGFFKYPVFGGAMLLIMLYPAMIKTLKSKVLLFFSVGIIVVFVSRGFLIQAAIQFIVFYFYRNRPRINVKFIILSVGLIVLTIIVIGMWGDLRSGKSALFTAMKIKSSMDGVPTPLLWVVTYISLPLENMTHILSGFTNYYYGKLTLASITPPFLWHVFSMKTPNELYDPIVFHYLPSPLNNMSTYSAIPYIDFGWLGVACFNLGIGLISGLSSFFAIKHPNNFNNAANSIIISCISLAFFWNLFLNITIISELFIAFAALKIKWGKVNST